MQKLANVYTQALEIENCQNVNILYPWCGTRSCHNDNLWQQGITWDLVWYGHHDFVESSQQNWSFFQKCVRWVNADFHTEHHHEETVIDI